MPLVLTSPTRVAGSVRAHLIFPHFFATRDTVGRVIRLLREHLTDVAPMHDWDKVLDFPSSLRVFTADKSDEVAQAPEGRPLELAPESREQWPQLFLDNGEVNKMKVFELT